MHDQMSVYRIQGEGLTYNEEALVRCKMNNPEHFMTLKENFPIVDSKPVDDTISKVFFFFFLIQKSFFDALWDYSKSFQYGACRFMKMQIQSFVHKLKK